MKFLVERALILCLGAALAACSHARKFNNDLKARTSTTEVQVRFAMELAYEGKVVNVPRVVFTSDESAITLGPVVNSRIGLTIANKSEIPSRIIWDESSIIDENGISHKILRSGIKLIDKEKATVPSVIPPQSKVEETIMVADWIEWSEGPIPSLTGWKYTQHFFGLDPIQQSLPVLTSKAKLATGKSLKVFLTTESDGERTSETYELKIGDSVIVNRPKGDMGPL